MPVPGTWQGYLNKLRMRKGLSRYSLVSRGIMLSSVFRVTTCQKRRLPASERQVLTRLSTSVLH